MKRQNLTPGMMYYLPNRLIFLKSKEIEIVRIYPTDKFGIYTEFEQLQIEYPQKIQNYQSYLPTIILFQFHSNFLQYFNYQDFLYFMNHQYQNQKSLSSSPLVCIFYYDPNKNVLIFAIGIVDYQVIHGLIIPQKVVINQSNIKIDLLYGLDRSFFILPSQLHKKKLCIDFWHLEENDYALYLQSDYVLT